ncbi:hypothetical protein A1O1_06696 [Capronia coronata CBS 617.96]|uniref:Bromo domain-containing protein n=1 Tax=Capronia coronata CBS 617.96 TaxID=1182541 RepID=W9XS72_9EURO|nr:uncharacterized protein A1O1_06696 [Capronia coronata CBS 617.96]EXJ83078.1 hypothetical protein A1O1_06696 [Capronia coronata CBS 617.96]
MPSLTAYTPYETLVFCHSVARHGSDSEAFENIANTLNANELIRENQTYDQTRLTASALQGLYQDLLVEENVAGVPTVNGDNVNPRKRKLSASPRSEKDEPSEEKILQSLVDKLYARFKEQTIREIRAEEEAYAEIKAEIAQLEKEVEDEQQAQSKAEAAKVEVQPQVKELVDEDSAPTEPEPRPSPDAAAAQLHASLDASRAEQVAPKVEVSPPNTRASPSSTRSGLQQHPVVTSASPAPPTPSVSSAAQPVESAQVRPSQHSGHPQHRSPSSFHPALPTPSPQRPNYASINPQHFQPGPQGHPVPVQPGMQGIPHMPPPAEYPGQKRASSSSGQGRGSPIPMPPQQPYPPYAGYPPPPWPHHIPPQHQYPQSPYGNPQYYMPSPPGRPGIPYQTPHHPAYQQYPQSAPIHYQGQPPPPHGWHPQSGQPYYSYHGSANVTPVPRSDSRRQLSRGRSSTPWKRRADLSTRARQPSPVRPERDVSPLTDTETPSNTKVRKSPERKGQRTGPTLLSAPEVPSARGRQATSATSSAIAQSRSESMASFTSDVPTEKRKRGRPPQKIKAEPPSTPAPMPSDNEQTQQTSGRIAKSQSGAATLTNEPTRTTKRKRSPERESATPPLPSPAPTAIPHSTPRDSSLVTVSKNFAKTSQLLLNEILSHKLAGIFAKPLSERDAPGYKSLVLRPQDLKSIKAAISRGGKAALAAIEALESDGESGEDSDAKITPASAPDAREGHIGNGLYQVKVSEDLVPPRGIVNSSQLEMELVRMFANAIMFNPLPTSERGFGRSLRLRKDQADLDSDEDTSDDTASSEQGHAAEEGGIISDTREMFDDVLAQIRKWREDVERLGADDTVAGGGGGAGGAGSKLLQSSGSFGAQQHGSASASVRHSSVGSALNEEETTAEVSTPVPTTGTARKRRRIAET